MTARNLAAAHIRVVATPQQVSCELAGDAAILQPATGVYYPLDPVPARIAWAVTTAARVVPGAHNCLVQALAAHALLGRHGHGSQVRLGVARTSEQGLEAHAWVECQGAVLVGGSSAGRYTSFPVAAG